MEKHGGERLEASSVGELVRRGMTSVRRKGNASEEWAAARGYVNERGLRRLNET
jgi:hypothetical protein